MINKQILENIGQIFLAFIMGCVVGILVLGFFSFILWSPVLIDNLYLSSRLCVGIGFILGILEIINIYIE